MDFVLLKIFKALADPTRIDIVGQLLKKKEFSCQELSKCFNLSQPALSHHFNKLIEAEIIIQKKLGVSHFYRVNQSYLNMLGINIKKLIKKGGKYEKME